jgi:arylsulfatase A-like enzyme
MHEADPPKPYDTLYMNVPREHDVPGFEKGTFNIRCFDDLLQAYLDGDLTPEMQQQVLALYDGEVRLVDDTLAKLFGTLRQTGLYDDTVIVIVADHGEMFFEKPGGAFGVVEPGHTATYFDEVLHVPLIIKPQRGAGLAGGVRLPQMVSTVDIVPTVFELLHHDAMPWLAGRSRVPLMRDPGARTEERVFFEETPYQKNWAGLRTPEWKLFEQRAGDFAQDFLIDLANDPREERNAALTAPEQVGKMKESLSAWLAGQKKIDPSSYADMSDKMRDELRRAGYIRDRKP